MVLNHLTITFLSFLFRPWTTNLNYVIQIRPSLLESWWLKKNLQMQSDQTHNLGDDGDKKKKKKKARGKDLI